MRRFLLTIMFLALAALALQNGSTRAAPARDHDGQPLSELIDLDKCHVVGAINENGNLLLECPPFPPADVPTDAPTATDTALPTETDTETPTETSTQEPTVATATQTATDTDTPAPTDTDTPQPTATATATDTPQPTSTDTPAPSATFLPTVMVSETPAGPGVEIDPYQNAPACASHDTGDFHTIWSTTGCHYDHEHGQNPFVAAVAAAFPGFDLQALLGGVGVGHTNPSGPMENTHKHGGFKWQVSLGLPCVTGFEGAAVCVTGVVIQYHAFGDSRMELEAVNGTRIHSAAALVRQGPLSDPGYLYTVQHVEYGEICASYQGLVVPYPQNFSPAWDCARGQYWTVPCFGAFSNCLPSIDNFRVLLQDADAIATTKKTGIGSTNPANRPPGSTLLNLLWRGRDTPQAFDASDLTYPFTYPFICSNDGGLTMAPANCRYNNSTTAVHEIAGVIPAAWDSLDGVVDGRVTYTGYTTRFGALAPACTAPGPGCHPIQMVRAYVGAYGGSLCPVGVKCSNTTPATNPERDIYFCGLVVCAETAPGAVSSGWIGAAN
jgi:hypothetical protein